MKLCLQHSSLYIITAVWSQHFHGVFVPFDLEYLIKKFMLEFPPTFYMELPQMLMPVYYQMKKCILFQWIDWTSYFFFNISWKNCNCNSSYIWSWSSLKFCEIVYAHNNIWILYRVIDLFEYTIIILRVIHFT